MEVLVLSQSREVGAQLARAVAASGYSCLTASSPSEALALLDDAVQGARHAPDVALLEVESGGLVVCRELLQRHEDLPVLLFSATRTEPLDRVAGFMLGADDYLVAPLDPEEVRWRIRRSLARGDARARAASPPPPPADSPLRDLSPRERDVLGLLLSGLSSRQIARHLVISEKTVGTHVQHILTKLEVHRRVDAVMLAQRLGFARDLAEQQVARLPWRADGERTAGQVS